MTASQYYSFLEHSYVVHIRCLADIKVNPVLLYDSYLPSLQAISANRRYFLLQTLAKLQCAVCIIIQMSYLTPSQPASSITSLVL